MKNVNKKFNKVLLYFIIAIGISCGNINSKWVKMDSNESKEWLTKFKDSSYYNRAWDTIKLIPNEEVAISVIEPILFNICGKNTVIEGRPYRINLIDNYWVIEGRNSGLSNGGGFLAVINSKDGKILGISRGK
jgi:hypothetical protein